MMSLAIAALIVESGSSFADDVAQMKKHTPVVVLKNSKGASVAVAPAYQGRVMTSAAKGSLPGNGWINHELIASGKLLPHINPFGGEDRLWLGPEGAQYSIFFPAGAKFDLEAWQTPALLDTLPFKVDKVSGTSVTLSQTATLKNYIDTEFKLGLTRTVRLLDEKGLKKNLGVSSKGLDVVMYESENTLKNMGGKAWSKDSGLLSIWILGMLKHSATTTVVMPIKPGSTDKLGPAVKDTYFGKVPGDRLKVTDSHVFFRADGEFRSKIGIPPKRAMPVCGSYDPGRGLLTIMQFTLPAGAQDYVNSMWELQDHPYAGDVSNSYNDGPPAPGKKPLGPFYEIESSSPALALGPGESATHFQRTFHFRGTKAQLHAIAKHVLGVDLTVLENKSFWK